MTKPELPPENIYGHTKKLRFFLDGLDRYIRECNAPVRVLDFGCGNGSAISQFIAQRPITYYGVDLHQPSLDYARRYFQSEKAFFLDHVPPGVKFDVIIYSDVLEHLAQPEIVLRDHWPALKTKGLILGSVPNGYGPFENEKRLVRGLGVDRAIAGAVWVKRRLMDRRLPVASIPYNDESGHVQFFTRRSLLATLQRTGYHLECFTNGAFLGAPLSEVLVLRGARIAQVNTWIADHLPSWAVSTWYFSATKQPSAGGKHRDAAHGTLRAISP